MTEYLPGIVEPNQEALQLATGFSFTEGPICGIPTATGCSLTCAGNRR